MTVATVDVHRWSREEYERMAGTGLLPPEARVELIDGIIYDMAAQSGPHVTGVHLVLAALQAVLPSAYIRVQSPLALDDDSEPEPDLAIVPGSARDYLDEHPRTALLVVEVADSSLGHDRKRKLPRYARAGIPDVWILDLTKRALEVCRDPDGTIYRSRILLRAGDTISPLARPDAGIAVADLLP